MKKRAEAIKKITQGQIIHLAGAFMIAFGIGMIVQGSETLERLSEKQKG